MVPGHGHPDGPISLFQKGLRPDLEGDELRLQGGLVFVVVFDTKIIHSVSLFS